MPELPEVQTTVDGLIQVLPEKKIVGVWSEYDSPTYAGKNQIKNRKYFADFEKQVTGKKFIGAERRGKNVLIHLSGNKTIVVHMKMTGHLLFGKYKKVNGGSKFKLPKRLPEEVAEKWKDEKWVPNESANSPLWDTWNRHIRLVFTLSNKKHLVLSDVRKFAKVLVLDSNNLDTDPELGKLGPNPLKLTFSQFLKRIGSRKSGQIKQVLMDQKVLAGIGNIYSDEALWEVDIHPASKINRIPEAKYGELFEALKKVLRKGIKFSGDSTSDYRRPDGKKGEFQKKHNVYGRKKEKCPRNDGGEIAVTKVGGRTAHFCPKHQKRY